MTLKDENAVMGKITSVYGVKGWVKVVSYTQPKENLCKYKTWGLELSGKASAVKVSHCKSHANGLVAQLDGCADRELAKQYCGSLVTVSQSELPELGVGEFYWHQLEGLFVIAIDTSSPDDSSGKLPSKLLGKVSHLIETGSNDVIVVKKCEGSIDGKERMIPYLPDLVVKRVCLIEGVIEVDWDSDF